MARIVERPRARTELEEIAVHIARNRPSAARAFLAAARKAYDNLAAMPDMASLWEPEDPRFGGIRYFPIPRYPNYVIFAGRFLTVLKSSTSWTHAGTSSDC
ncbi:MAG TPA: type II toxin-antitoxin system RelE/ParE family toxin [Gemmataceae bacterium]|jgi:plasmid stabilization system protein ParE|nr:type II toxin-antitoxin system RelE/ParE family toxin [Gemmataceae bacterium]